MLAQLLKIFSAINEYLSHRDVYGTTKPAIANTEKLCVIAKTDPNINGTSK
jgi:hypothetical protein